MGEKWPVISTESCDFHEYTYATWDTRLYFPSEGRPAEDFFFALKNPTTSAGFEPANLGTKGQHATSRPPKPHHKAVNNFSIKIDEVKPLSSNETICWCLKCAKEWLNMPYAALCAFTS